MQLRTDVDVAEASNGQEAIERSRKMNPALIILDMTMPVISGIQAARRLKKEMPQIPILTLSRHEEHAIARELAQIGVQGFVSKSRKGQGFCGAEEAVSGSGEKRHDHRKEPKFFEFMVSSSHLLA